MVDLLFRLFLFRRLLVFIETTQSKSKTVGYFYDLYFRCKTDNAYHEVETEWRCKGKLVTSPLLFNHLNQWAKSGRAQTSCDIEG